MLTRSNIAAVVALSLCGCTPDPAEAPLPPPPPPVVAPLALPTSPTSMTPSLAVDGADLLLVWQTPVADGYAVRFARLHEGTWSAPSTFASGPEVFANWADFPAVFPAPNGTLAAHWLRKGATDGAYDVELVRSRDGGATWSDLGRPYTDPTPAEHGFVSYLADAGGVRLHWLDGRGATGGHDGHGGNTQLRTALVTAEGVQPDAVIDDRVCDCCGTDAARAESGGALVVYRDRDDTERRDVSAASSLGDAWTAGQPVGAEGWEIHGCPVNGPAIATVGDGLAVAWFTGAADGQRVRAAFTQTGSAALGAPVEVALATTDARPVGRVDIAGDLDGTAIVTWLSAEGGDGRVRARRVAADGRVGATIDLGDAGTARATGFPRLVRTQDGFVAAWTGDAGIVAARFPGEAVPPVETTPVAVAPATRAPTTLPAFDLGDLAGQRVRAADLAGHPVLLNVWATWCGPCRDELPELLRLQAAHPDVAGRALSLDGVVSGGSVRKMAERLAPGLRVLHPDDGGVAVTLGVSALPRTLLFDGSGQLCWASTGALRAADPAVTAAIAACASASPAPSRELTPSR